MAAEAPQNLKNHTRWDPAIHFFVFPVLVVTALGFLYAFFRHPNVHSGWMVIFYVALVALAWQMRSYSLKVQTRVIRLEERLRLTALLQEPWRSRIGELTESQLVALRFASDAEIPSLVQSTLNHNLTNAQIKKEIRNWRADWFRV